MPRCPFLRRAEALLRSSRRDRGSASPAQPYLAALPGRCRRGPLASSSSPDPSCGIWFLPSPPVPGFLLWSATGKEKRKALSGHQTRGNTKRKGSMLSRKYAKRKRREGGGRETKQREREKKKERILAIIYPMPQMHPRPHRNPSTQQHTARPGTSNARRQSLLSRDLKALPRGR